MSYQDERKDQEHKEDELLTEAERDSLWETDVKDEQYGAYGEKQGPTKAPYDPDEPLYTALWKMWIAPKRTIRRIVEVNPRYLVLFFGVLLAGLAQGVGNMTFLIEMNTLFDLNFDFDTLLIFSFITGFITAAIIFFLGSALFKWVGGWLGGKATHQETRAAYAWSNVTLAVTLPLSVLMIAVLGIDYFYLDPMNMSFIMNNPVTAVLYTLTSMLSLAAFVWGLIILIGAMSEVHQFSIGRTFGTIGIIIAIIFGVTIVFSIAALILGAVIVGSAL